MLEILHGSGAVVEPAGLDPGQSSSSIDEARDEIENITKKDFEPMAMDADKIDQLNNQHDPIKYIIRFNVNLSNVASRSRKGRSGNQGQGCEVD